MKMDIGTAVKDRILELCKERNITVNKLGTICGVTQSTLNNIVNGRNKSTTVSTIKKVCDGLEISINDFFDSPLFEGLEQEIK
ncbi:helix-turn-helix transcriptional regulator [Anaerotruncus rubiinfantis]|uniref:helix-turn-helix domain-containing protein n=2 Tax=Oscillospiraceae TaxID=216572 RepID=UPI00268B11A8